ncbi:VWA domain-containing protein [Flavobacterium zepuense]|uniref:VWA domain-containing protein n=1 Tax=Flavobacterium zepuense TaxID=2593302 RepID=A0A552V2S0_9FLAO|nr:vWA domain-containing protein [Flavobacterium zepuense]TRW24751.1 VWA domain-containing protein [Flavobacterium zepuense]
MKTITLSVLLLTASLSFAGCKQQEQEPVVALNTITEPQPQQQPLKPNVTNKIQVALLLDTSNSMDGLIDQAKARLWNIVNTLTTLKYSGQTPDIEIALYEYGNDGLGQQTNYIRQVAPLTTDLDLISEKLFTLRTNGGSEYCGAVIKDATQQLKWGANTNDMKLLYIAGNEGFDQGGISYKEAISDALKSNIYVNTIYCGSQAEGVQLHWKDGADKGSGKFFNIDSDKAVQYVETPYDDKITICNERMNKTYINYGREGESKKMNQEVQDNNARTVSKSNYTERAVSKSKEVYKNDSWDLVDKVKQDKDAVSKIKKEELPKELQNKSTAEIKAFVDTKAKEREAIQKEIGELAKKRQEYIDNETKKTNSHDDLGNAMSTSIIAFAKIKGYSVEK